MVRAVNWRGSGPVSLKKATFDHPESESVVDEGQPVLPHDLEAVGIGRVEQEEHAVGVAEEVLGEKSHRLGRVAREIPQSKRDAAALEDDDFIEDVFPDIVVVGVQVSLCEGVVGVIFVGFEKLSFAGRSGP